LGLFRRKRSVTLSLAELCEDGFVAIVGESHYQDALRATARSCRETFEGRPAFTAALLAEPDNPYDGNAVAVWSPQGKLGYLSRDAARDYRRLFAELRRRGHDGGACPAHVTGGDGGKLFGVVLRLADPETCFQELGDGDE
jgi:hypothetical protein